MIFNNRLLFHFQVQRHTKGLMLGAVALHQTAAAAGSSGSAGSATAFDWEAERISYDAMRPHLDEIEFVRQLQQATIVCGVCRRRTLIDARIEGIEYCTCGSSKATKQAVSNTVEPTDNGQKFNEWKPYLERENMVVWRREERSGQFAYKGIFVIIHLMYIKYGMSDFSVESGQGLTIRKYCYFMFKIVTTPTVLMSLVQYLT